MLESVFATQVEHLLRLFGWTWCHFEPAVRQSGSWATPMRGDKGLPDYIATREGRLIMAEIKGDNGRLSKFQKDWIEQLEQTPAETYVWYPCDIHRIKDILR